MTMNGSLLIQTATGYREVPVLESVALDEELYPTAVEGIVSAVAGDDVLRLSGALGEFSVSSDVWQPCGNKTCMWIPARTAFFDVVRTPRIDIGPHSYRNIRISDFAEACYLENNILYIEQSGETYVNGRRIEQGEHAVEPGDCLHIGPIRLHLLDGILAISGKQERYTCAFTLVAAPEFYPENFPVYMRSPRVIKRLPGEAVAITAPPKREVQKGQLLKSILPPLMSMGMMLVVSIFNPRGIYILVSVGTVVVSTVFTTTNYFRTKKESKEKMERETVLYEARLSAWRKQLNRLVCEQKDAMRHHFPALFRIERMAARYDSRIYEVAANDGDFLHAAIGAAPMPLAGGVTFEEPEDIKDIDVEFLEDARGLAEEYAEIADMPVVIDLKRAHLGLVGQSGHIHEQLKLLIAQLTIRHSYHDMQIVLLTDDKNRDAFEWITWYPHCRIQAINMTGLVTTENLRDQVLGHLGRVLKDRKLKMDSKNREAGYLPHYFFIIDDPRLIINHSIMEYLQGGDPLGFTLIYTTDLQSSLPEYIKTVLLLSDSRIGNLYLDEGKLTDKVLSLYRVGSAELEHMSRALHPLKHVKGIATQIPESITFFDMYGVKHPHELEIDSRWEKSNSHKTLAVPLGLRGKDDIVYLNLHEKAHGPHGLVAGTTGSGKSEIVQSYILSLAVNFHPHEVGFLLIDYKGGGMASLFSKLPHLLGTITNLDGSESMRAMASIKSELRRRQAVFNEYGVNHINNYNRLFKEGRTDKPLPHLFLISDEFAELKKEQPDFMSELVSAARIGRSLGIHLILATQKPSGVVDDQIWSNSKFKLALKVQNESDSNEVIKTPDAASITQPGRAYLQVGNNEIYELFQSAWSGASYSEETEARGFDDRVYMMNALGQGQLLNQDLSSGGVGESSMTTQLDAVVGHIHDVYNEMDAQPVDKPWLPSLKVKIPSPYTSQATEGVRDLAAHKSLNLTAPIGMIDIPQEQAQEEYVLDLPRDGNLAIFASSGYGKSMTMTTIAMTLAVKNSPELLQYQIIDLGNSALIPLQKLPHTADYFSVDQVDKLQKFIRRTETELARRKSLFAQASAMNFSMYNEVAKEKLPAIVVFVDNYDVVRELGQELDDFFGRLSRDGAGVGVYMVISATRVNAVRYAVLSNFKNKIGHFMFEAADLSAAVGRPPYPLPEIQGRAFIKRKEVLLMQVYAAVDFESEIEYVRGVDALVTAMDGAYTGLRPEAIRMLPETLSVAALDDAANRLPAHIIPLGLDAENAEAQGLNLHETTHLIVGPTQSGKTNALSLCLDHLLSIQAQVFLFDSRDMALLDYRGTNGLAYASDESAAAEAITALSDIVMQRKMMLEQAMTINQSVFPRTFFQGMERIAVLIDDADRFVELLKGNKEAEKLLAEAVQTGVNFITATAGNRMKGFDTITKMLKETSSGLILGNPSEQTLLPSPMMRGYKKQLDMGMIYRSGELTPIKLPKARQKAVAMTA